MCTHVSQWRVEYLLFHLADNALHINETQKFILFACTSYAATTNGIASDDDSPVQQRRRDPGSSRFIQGHLDAICWKEAQARL